MTSTSTAAGSSFVLNSAAADRTGADLHGSRKTQCGGQCHNCPMAQAARKTAGSGVFLQEQR